MNACEFYVASHFSFSNPHYSLPIIPNSQLSNSNSNSNSQISNMCVRFFILPLHHTLVNMLASIVWFCLVGSLWSPACGFSPSTQAPRTSRHISLSVATPTRIEFDHALQNEGRDDDDDPFTLLSTLAATTLLQSDRRRDAIGKDAGAQASSGEFFQNTFDFVNVIYS